MTHTRHMMTRMNLPGMTHDLVDLALEYGECQNDKHVLTQEGLQHMLLKVRNLERAAIRALDKGGVVVVEDGGQLITTYAAIAAPWRYVRDRKW